MLGHKEISEQAREAVMADLRAHCRPEFLNRVDDIVLFRPLGLTEIEKIVDILLSELRGRLADRKITVTMTENARKLVAAEGYDPIYGARPLKRYLQRQVETKLARALIGGSIADGDAVTIDAEAGELTVRSDAAVVSPAAG